MSRGWKSIQTLLVTSVQRLATEQKLQRLLEQDPQQALRQCGLSALQTKLKDLRVPVNQISVWLDDNALFMPHVNSEVSNLPIPAILAASGAKPLALLHGPARDLAAILRSCESAGLFGCLGPQEYQVYSESGRGSYHNLVQDQIPSRGMSNAWRTLLVSVDLDRVVLGYLALLCSWDSYLGELLGYPDCCAKAFAKRWPEAVAKYEGDVATQVVEDSGQGHWDWRLNILLRYSGCEMIQHFPCSFSCKKSIKLAKKYELSLTQYAPQLAAEQKKKLAVPVLYAGKLGIAPLVEAELQSDNSWQWNGVKTQALPGADKSLKQALRQGDSKKIKKFIPKIKIVDFSITSKNNKYSKKYKGVTCVS